MNSDKPFEFILYGQPRTKKNSSRILRGHARLLPSKAYAEYEAACRRDINSMRYKMRLPHYSLPVRLTCRYYLENKRGWPDLVGLMQATADIISDEYKTVKGKRALICKWLLSDDRIIKEWDGTRIMGIDKERPRVEIIITPLEVSLETEIDPYIIRQLEEIEQGKLFDS